MIIIIVFLVNLSDIYHKSYHGNSQTLRSPEIVLKLFLIKNMIELVCDRI